MGAGMWADLVMSGFCPRNIGAIAGKKEAEVLLLHKQARLLAPFVESMLDPRFGDCIPFKVRIASPWHYALPLLEETWEEQRTER